MSAQSTSGGKTLLIIVIAIVVVAAATGIWYFGFYAPAKEAEEQARLEQIARAEAEKKRQEKAAQDKARYDQLIADADAAFNSEDWESAGSLYTDASRILSNEQYPKDQLVLVNTTLDEIAALEARRQAGEIETISEPTGRYYIIVSSSIDDDLALDYAKKLAYDGANTRIIEHTAGDIPYYRVTVSDYASLEEAQNAMPSFSSFENGVWVLRY